MPAQPREEDNPQYSGPPQPQDSGGLGEAFQNIPLFFGLATSSGDSFEDVTEDAYYNDDDTVTTGNEDFDPWYSPDDAADDAQDVAENAPNTLRNIGPEWLDEGALIVLVVIGLWALSDYAELANTAAGG